ncbi:MAG: bifunctional diaminohydroxyphosphoribosylaminopyrimidine deaminase/5-amino-6-(5-phosphoribosylamino)uracil reductase RibD [Prevotellaceae bacterium]|nr:bifunctional diaminohydroxyphosphoribosylaminopyrimidine deaminase/5-amino-6-(5-phosphoribosylamino)uracil reductase RibD [Prevotellaceae bacterium]
MEQTEIDKKYMRRCLQLARNGVCTAAPNPMVGAVLVYDGRIIGEGYHIKCGEAHAEVNCFASVKTADEPFVPQATLYVSLEPCAHYGHTPPCADLVVRKGVRRVVVGCVDPFAKVQGKGIRRIREAGIEVTVGVLEEECRQLNRRFFTFHTYRRPYILLKWAQTTDGFLDCNYRPTAISNAFTRMLCHKLRAECDAILVGRVTAEHDRPQLTVRHWVGPHPLRIVLSHDTSIEAVLESLYQQNCQSLIVEGGAKTLQSFIEKDLWDELRVERAPLLAGAGTCAPQIPKGAVLVERHVYDGHELSRFICGQNRLESLPSASCPI